MTKTIQTIVQRQSRRCNKKKANARSVASVDEKPGPVTASGGADEDLDNRIIRLMRATLPRTQTVQIYTVGYKAIGCLFKPWQ